MDFSRFVYYIGAFYVALPILVVIGFSLTYLSGKSLAKEALERWIEISKWYMSSVAIVFATSLVTNAFTERETGIKEMQLYDKYVQHILEENNIYKRMKLAQYFATVTPTERLRTRWEAYELKLVQEEKAYEDLLAEIERTKTDSAVQQADQSLALLSKQRAAFEEPLKNISTAVSRIDIFYLEGSESAEAHARELEELLEGTNYRVVVKRLLQKTNSKSGYRVENNQIRSEYSESTEANYLRELLGEDLEIRTITHKTPGYLSVFLVD